MACTGLFAQSHVDALRYSQHQIGGTARYTAMGGAFGALGGDFSTLSHNPAGIGVYRSSEFTFSPEFYIDNTKSRYFGKEVSETKLSMNLNNLGYVATFKEKNGALKYVNWGLGYNKIANFNKSYTINGDNPYSTFVDYMASQATSYNLDAFNSGLFWEGYLIDYDDVDNFYYVTPDYFANDTITEQKITSNEYGKINEYTLSVGFNFSDAFYFGGTFGIQPVRYRSERITREFDAAVRSDQFFKYTEDLKVNGTGYTAKIGAIFKPVQMVRLGAAFHLPVTYRLSERYTTELESIYQSEIFTPRDAGSSSDYLESNYKVVTPFKAIGSAALVVGKFLLVSTDLEYIDYSSMRMSSSDFDLDDQNELIQDIYRENINIKLGSELRFGNTYLRGGLAYFGSPYAQQEDNTDAFRLNYSLGVGFRDKKFFFDVAYQFNTYDERQYQYSVYVWDVLYEPAANLDTKTHRLTTTIGFRF
jgi:hypothetical protein